MKNILFIAVLTVLPLNAMADFSADALAKICNQETLKLSKCEAIQSSTRATFTAKEKRKLQGQIENSTDHWGDSVYEGDVDGVEAGLKYSARKLVERSDSALLGYIVRFSYEGWETSCAQDDYDRSKPETYKNCEKGRIYQTIIVSADLRHYEVLREAELILSKEN